MKIISKIEPQPPEGLKYMIGGESWLPPEDRTPIRLVCEEWGNLGPAELNSEIQPNKPGLRVRATEIAAPIEALGYVRVSGIYFWTNWDMRVGCANPVEEAL
ncbi:hypothetical protein ACCP99_08085 [Xanthomonas sp. NCPPB 3443]|uniref:hypothetical protein n=1 Tax=Xanthomonas sp. NCPPB 3443 TaxID=3243407 RepID=UPI0035561CA2